MKTFTKELQQSQKDWKIMNNPFLDDSPLTDEALQDLGFEFVEKNANGKKLNMWTKIVDGNIVLGVERYGERRWISIIPHKADPYPKWATVGSVKMLIEALKGDE